MDKKQPEALRLADELCEAIAEYPEPTALEAQAAAELLRQHAENETLRAGYAAARLEVGSLRSQAPQQAAQADSVQEDAARYRFLRDGEWRDTDLEPFIRLQLNTLWDAKIDAARKQGATT